MARGNWTRHTNDPQGEMLRLIREAGGSATIPELYQRGAWGLRIQTVKALIRKGHITCAGTDLWHDKLTLKG